MRYITHQAALGKVITLGDGMRHPLQALSLNINDYLRFAEQEMWAKNENKPHFGILRKVAEESHLQRERIWRFDAPTYCSPSPN